MKHLELNHISGYMHILLKGNKVKIMETLNNITGEATFKNPQDAFRFVGEYLISYDYPTKEFQKLFPQFC